MLPPAHLPALHQECKFQIQRLQQDLQQQQQQRECMQGQRLADRLTQQQPGQKELQALVHHQQQEKQEHQEPNQQQRQEPSQQQEQQAQDQDQYHQQQQHHTGGHKHQRQATQHSDDDADDAGCALVGMMERHLASLSATIRARDTEVAQLKQALSAASDEQRQLQLRLDELQGSCQVTRPAAMVGDGVVRAAASGSGGEVAAGSRRVQGRVQRACAGATGVRTRR